MIDLGLEELQYLSIAGIVRESVAITRASPRTFSLQTLTLVFPLSFAVLAHNIFTHPLLLHITSSNSTYSSDSHYLALLLIYQFLYLLFLFTFSLLSTAAVVFTVASLYSSSSKPVSFSSSLSVIPSIFPRLFLTFLHVSLLVLLYNVAFFLSLLLIFLLSPSNPYSPVFLIPIFLLLLAFLLAHLYISALWHLASVVSVLEPLRGLAAIRKAFHLLQGNTRPSLALVTAYLAACGIIGALFRAVIVAGPGEEGSLGLGLGAKILFGGALVSALVIVNLVGLLVQSVFYYVCKSYHHQGIDKDALADHLGGYLGEYVPLKSSIQMESI